MEPDAGRLLVASPTLADPNFARTLVVLVSRDDDGALGVILNRPSQTAVGEVLAAWGDLVRAPSVLFHGGPVDTDSALALARVATVAGAPVGWRGVFGPIGVVDLDAPTDLVAPGLEAVRVYAGYAGWGGGQLEEEIAEGAWYVVPAAPEDLFSTDPEHLWEQVLRRQDGELRLMSTMPTDPGLN